MTHKERTAWLRRVLKSYGPKARVSMYESCGSKWIKVCVPSYDARFTPDELEQIAHAARGNHLTFARGMEVTVEQMRQMTGRHQFDFVCNG
jgi:hypothetical protein